LAAFILLAIFAPEEYRNREPAAAKVDNEPSSPPTPIEKPYNLIFKTASGIIGVEGIFEGKSLFLHNISGGDFNRLMIAVDVWKDNAADSTYTANIDILVNSEVIEISNWTEIKDGKITSNRSLPGDGYTFRNVYFDCEEGDYQVHAK
jgi:hypothetical protein